MIQTAERTYTIEEYLELEINSKERHEFWDGAVRLMTGGTPESSFAGQTLPHIHLRPTAMDSGLQHLHLPGCDGGATAPSIANGA
jgi:hypothetical protein